MIVDALSVCMSDDPQGNAKLIFSLLDCLSRVNRVSRANYRLFIRFIERKNNL